MSRKKPTKTEQELLDMESKNPELRQKVEEVFTINGKAKESLIQGIIEGVIGAAIETRVLLAAFGVEELSSEEFRKALVVVWGIWGLRFLYESARAFMRRKNLQDDAIVLTEEITGKNPLERVL